jgi:hypothetical protein
MKRNKNITEKDIYHFYPYRKNPVVTGKTIPQPYVKKEDISNHPHALTYDVWLSIIKDYILEIREYIFKGKVFKLPRMLGVWQMKKYMSTKRIDWGTTNRTGEKTYYNDKGNYRLLVKWYRTYQNSSFVFKNHWKLRMAKGFRIALYNTVINDSNYIYNIIDA